MSLQTRLEALVAAIGADIKSLRAGSFTGSVTAQTGLFDGANRAYSDSNPPETLVHTITTTAPTTPAAARAVTTVRAKQVFVKFPDATETELTGSVKQFAITLATSATSYVVTHNLGTKDVMVQFYGTADPWRQQWATIDRTTINTITASFTTAPAAGAVRVVVQGRPD